MLLQGISLAWYLSVLAWQSMVHQPDCEAFSSPYSTLQTDPSANVRRVLKDMLLCEVDVDEHLFHTRYGYGTGLMVAAQKGFPDVVSELAKKTNNIDRVGGLGHTALMLAAENGHHHAASILLEHGANVNAKSDYRQYAALWPAVQNCHEPVVSVLLENGADPNARDGIGRTVLIEAAKHCQPQIISKLLENGADINMQSTRTLTLYNFYTPLMMAAQKGNNQACLVLLDNGADVNIVTDEGMTALMMAAKYDQFEVVKTLLAHGAEQQNALIFAGINGNLDIFAFLLDNGADMSSLNKHGDGYTPLIFAVNSYFNDNMTAINMVHILLEHGADANLRNAYGDTALMKAAAAGYRKETIVAALLDHGADVNLQNNVSQKFYNYTALMYASEKGHEKTV